MVLHASVHVGVEVAQAVEVGAVCGEVCDDTESVDQSLPGGRGAPFPVVVRDPGEVVDGFAVGPLDQCVAPQQPAGAGVGQIALWFGAGRGAPCGAVGGLGPVQ